MSKGARLPDGVQKAKSARIPAAGRLALAATWEAKEGDGDAAADILRRMTNEVKTEPGTLLFWPHRSPANDLVFFLYELFADDATISGGLNGEEVRFWPIADMHLPETRVRNWAESGRPEAIFAREYGALLRWRCDASGKPSWFLC